MNSKSGNVETVGRAEVVEDECGPTRVGGDMRLSKAIAFTFAFYATMQLFDFHWRVLQGNRWRPISFSVSE